MYRSITMTTKIMATPMIKTITEKTLETLFMIMKKHNSLIKTVIPPIIEINIQQITEMIIQLITG